VRIPALEVLCRLRESRDEPDWVIRGARKGQPFVGLHRVWERIRESAGLGDVRIHDLRHYPDRRIIPHRRCRHVSQCGEALVGLLGEH